MITIDVFFEKGLLPLIATFVGAGLAFWAQSHRAQREIHHKKCDLLIAVYRTATTNLGTLNIFKANFLMEFGEDFECLKKFFLEYVNPVPSDERLELEEQWKSGYHGLFLKLAHGVSEPCLLRHRWERPILLPLLETDLTFVARDRPTILNIISMLRSAETILTSALDNREAHALSLDPYFSDPSFVVDGDIEFIKKVTLLMLEISIITDAVDRLLALNFGLVCLLENYYFLHNKSINFKRVRFSDKNLSVLPDMNYWIDFCGNEEDKYIIRQRLEYSRNTINGHRELNHPTGYIPKGL